MTDYSVFAIDDFDPNDYANAILAGESYPLPAHSDPKFASSRTGTKAVDSSTKEDISVAISKLNFGIDDVSKQIKTLVSNHHEALLSQAANANKLSGSLTSVRSGICDLDSSLEKLRQKIRVPYHSLQTHVTRLQKLQLATDVLRRTSRFTLLVRRLQSQMADMEAGTESVVPESAASEKLNALDRKLLGTDVDTDDQKERTIAKAALSIAELVSLLDGPGPEPFQHTGQDNGDGRSENLESDAVAIPLRSINSAASHISFIEASRVKVTSEMETMVMTGLKTLNQSLLASSLQTAYNLRVLPELVQSLLLGLSQTVEQRISSAFDLSKISKEVLSKESTTPTTPLSASTYKSRVRTEPTNVTAPQWTAALWGRLETLIEEMSECCIKVYTLEKVLKLKRDIVTQVMFLDEAMKVLENNPSAIFWSTLGRSLEKHAKDAAKGSTFLQQTLGMGYPRLLRLVHEFFAKITVHTDTVYSDKHQSPETVIVLRAFSVFEAHYLSRSSNKLNEAVSQAFSGGSRTPPSGNDGVNVARTVANELDSAKFDPLLVRSVAKNAVSSLESMFSRADGLIVRDRTAVTMIGPTATPQQISNGQIASFLYHCWTRLEQLESDHSDLVMNQLKPAIQLLHQLFDHLVDPMMMAVRRELSAIIAKLHRLDFSKAMDPMAGMGGSSFYMKDLIEKLSFIKSEILVNFKIGDAGRTWVVSIVKFVIKTFVLHVSIAKPLGESGKLQLTSDMTELEFALSAFMVEGQQGKRGGSLESVGDDYRILRSIRPLLFLENSQLADRSYTAGLPALIILHHILVRSPIPLPHSLHGWQEAEYVKWVSEHSEEETWTLVDGGLAHWEKIAESEGRDTSDAQEYIQLARAVLREAEASHNVN